MRILALETTEKVATIAVADDSSILASQPCNPKLRSAQALVPGILQLLQTVSWRPNDVELVAVSVGPGSFTGLRVGIVSAKVFAYAVGAEVLGVDSLETIAAAAPSGTGQLWASVDAQRGQWVVRQFDRPDQRWPRPLGPGQLVDAQPWLAALPPDTVLTGPVLHKAADRLPGHIRPLPQAIWSPSAELVARLAVRDYAAGRREDLWTLAPQYSRPSAAEEKLARMIHDDVG